MLHALVKTAKSWFLLLMNYLKWVVEKVCASKNTKMEAFLMPPHLQCRKVCLGRTQQSAHGRWKKLSFWSGLESEPALGVWPHVDFLAIIVSQSDMNLPVETGPASTRSIQISASNSLC